MWYLNTMFKKKHEYLYDIGFLVDIRNTSQKHKSKKTQTPHYNIFDYIKIKYLNQ